MTHHPAVFTYLLSPVGCHVPTGVLENQDVRLYYPRRAVIPLVTRPSPDARYCLSGFLQIAYFVK